MSKTSSKFVRVAGICVLSIIVASTARGSWLSDTLRRNKIIPAKKVKAVAKALNRNKQKIDKITEAVGERSAAAPKAPAPPGVDSDRRFVSYYETALPIVTTFETGSSRVYDDVTPDFDYQGLTVGLLGWNIGQESLQPMIRSVGRDVVRKCMRNYGDQFWRACVSPVLEGLSIVRSWQQITPGRRAAWKPEHKAVVLDLKRLLGSPQMKAAQNEAAKRTAASAWLLALEWAEAVRDGRTPPTLREFTAFYDALTQNGSMKGLTYDSVKSWIARNRSERPMTVICDWLARVQPDDYQAEDAPRNASLWRTEFPKKYETLVLLHWLRAQEAYANRFRVQHNVLSRRGTILSNNGWVNGHQWRFEQLNEADVLPNPSTAKRAAGAATQTSRSVPPGR